MLCVHSIAVKVKIFHGQKYEKLHFSFFYSIRDIKRDVSLGVTPRPQPFINRTLMSCPSSTGGKDLLPVSATVDQL